MARNSVAAGVLAVACGAAHANPHLEVRLQTPLTSYGSKPGTEVRTVVIAPYSTGGRTWLPAGTLVFGTMRRARGVGLGLLHERAALGLRFDGYELPDGRRFPLRATLYHIENSRENVAAGGEIRGILATASPQTLVHGLWRKPDTALFQRSFVGLTGAAGRIHAEYSMGGAALFAIRCAMFRMPEPEIRLPSGAELKLAIAGLDPLAPAFEPEPERELPSAIAEWTGAQPFQVYKPAGRPARDIVNVAFFGSREPLSGAFQSAGWSEAERLNPRSFSRAYRAYTRQSGYASAPASKLLYGGQEPEFVYQKSLNTLARRHHVRLWPASGPGGEVWLRAATHDIGIGFDSAAMTFSHRIHPRIDFERRKVVNDLRFAGCAGQAGYVERAAAVRLPSESRGVVTAGRIAVIDLRDCVPDSAGASGGENVRPPGSTIARMGRRMILEGRNYVLRGSPYYWAYRALRFKRAAAASVPGVEE